MIQRDIYIYSRRPIAPICVVYGADGVGIELNLVDYTIPAGATAVAHAKPKNSEAAYQNPCSIVENRITLYPAAGFFMPGDNLLQIDVATGGKHVLTFAVTVFCEPDIAGGEPLTPVQVIPIVERAEAASKDAAQAASAAKKAADTANAAALDCAAATKSATDAASALLNQAGTIALQINAKDCGLDILVFEEDA